MNRLLRPADGGKPRGALCAVFLPLLRGADDDEPTPSITGCRVLGCEAEKDDHPQNPWCGSAQLLTAFCCSRRFLQREWWHRKAGRVWRGGGGCCDTALQCQRLLLLVGPWRIHENWQWGQGDNLKELKQLETWREKMTSSLALFEDEPYLLLGTDHLKDWYTPVAKVEIPGQ